MHFIRKIFEIILDQFFPITCVACGSYGTDLCNSCIQEFKWPKPQKIPWITSLWNYRDPRAEAVLRHIKTLPNNRIAYFCSKLFAQLIVNRPQQPSDWVMIPIPISRKRFRERGYNQSLIIARPLALIFGIALVGNALVKTRHTQKQGTSRTTEERALNNKDAFSVINQNLILGKNIILIDDIVTTGSTLSEARITLLTAGAKRVIAWTLAN
jgi:ComF family protein